MMRAAAAERTDLSLRTSPRRWTRKAWDDCRFLHAPRFWRRGLYRWPLSPTMRTIGLRRRCDARPRGMPPSCADQQHPAAVGRDGRTAEDYKSVYRRRHRAAVSAKQPAAGVSMSTRRLCASIPNLNTVAHRRAARGFGTREFPELGG